MDERDRQRYDRSRYKKRARTASSTNEGGVRASASEGRLDDPAVEGRVLAAQEREHEGNETPDQNGDSGNHATYGSGVRFRPEFYERLLIADAAESGEPASSGVAANPRPSVRQQAHASQPDRADQSARRSYSREAVENRVAQKATEKRKRGRGFKVAIMALVAALVIGVGAAIAYVAVVSGNLHAGVDDDLRGALVHTDMANEPFYMLLLGTDASKSRDETGETDGIYRSDSMILARIDARQKKATLISISRDIVVDLGQYGEQKINAAYAFGGPALAVQTVSTFAGVPISHYAEVNFDGFRAIVDALGGIEVDVPMSIDDWEAGGSVAAGLQTLDGDHALVLARSRETYSDLSTRPDDMRSANQRLVLSAIAKKVLASDVATIATTVQAMSQYVTTDLEVNDIIGLAQAMRGLEPDSDIYTASVPCEAKYIDDGWYDFVKKSEWAAMMKRVKAGEPPTEEALVDEATGVVLATAGSGASTTAERYATVAVRNGNGADGLATDVRRKLIDAGFVNVEIGNVAPGFDYPDTLVVYDEPGRAREAADIASIIGQGEAMQNDGSYLLLDTDIMVIIGRDWQS